MQFSYKWLRALSGTQAAPAELAEALTLKAFEVEEIVPMDRGLEKVVVGAVRAVEKHPDADRLNVAQVDVGEDAPRTIVCGAPNLAVGQKVPVALPGAVLPTADGKGFVIKKGVIRGVESDGMICAEDELGLGDDHEGIMVLPEDASVGTLFAAYMGLDDTALEIDILPNRAHDCLSHEGVAREIAVIERRTFTPAPVAEDLPAEALAVQVETPACSRYSAVLCEGVDNTGALPQALRTRLHVCGLRSISPVVDVTNLVMLQTGQPLHAFDADKVTLPLTVRMARAGEMLTLLDERTVTLDPADIVIADANGPVALAGVMGGAASGVTAATTRVILEAAHFDPVAIRRTRARHGITSDAAFRFERDPDAAGVARARALALALLAEHTGAVARAAADEGSAAPAPRTVRVAPRAITRLLGADIATDEMRDILTRLGITTQEEDDGTLVCTVPTWRPDITAAADIAEEVGRLYGYENITPQPLPTTVAPPSRNEQRAFEHHARDTFVAAGFDEVKGYAFYGARDAAALGLAADAHVALHNPQSEHLALMRRTLTPALLRAVARNLTHTDSVQVFEIGRTFVPREGALPEERHTAGAAVATKDTTGAQFFALKGMVEAYCETLGIEDVRYEDCAADTDAVRMHPSRCARIVRTDGTLLGVLGEVAAQTLAHYGIKNVRVAVAELDLDALARAARAERFFAPLPRYPRVTRDLSMVVGERTRVADVERTIYDAGGALLTDVDLFDLYVDAKSGVRSMAFHLIFGAADRTLTSAEVDAAISAIITALERDTDITVKKQ